LEKRCTREAGQSHERIVCCHHHPIETDPIAVDLNTVLFRIKLTCRALLENVRTVAGNFFNQRAKIFPRMKFGLVGEPQRRQVEVRR
jgi:hypothetical protein